MSDEHHASAKTYFGVFIVLCLCTGISIVTDVIDIRGMFGTLFLIVAVLAVAMAKALFVMMFFMHLKFEGRWKYLLLAPTIILACGIPLALLPDIGVHYYTVDTPQRNVVHEDTGHGGADADAPEPADEDSPE